MKVKWRGVRSGLVSRTTSALSCGLAVFCFLSARGAVAEAQWQWEVSLGGGAEYNDNVDLLPEEGVIEDLLAEPGLGEGDLGEGGSETPEDVIAVPSRDEVISIAETSLGVDWDERDDHFHLYYDGAYRNYREELREDSWYHYLDAALEWRRWNPFRLEVTDTFDYTPRFITRPEADVSNQLQHNVLRVRPSLFWDLSRTTTLEVSYLEERETYPGEEFTLTGVDEVSRHIGDIEVGKRWSRRWENTFHIGGGSVEREISEDYKVMQVGIGGTHLLSPRVDLGYDLSLEQRWYDETVPEIPEPPVDPELPDDIPRRDDTPRAWVGEAVLNWRHHESGTLGITVGQDVEERFDGETILGTRGRAEYSWVFRGGSDISAGVSYVYLDYRLAPRKDTIWGPYLSAHWMITSWMAFDLGGEWRGTRIERDLVLETEEMEVVEDDLSRLEAAFLFSLGRYFQLEASYRYLDNGSDEPLRTYRQNLFGLMLTGTM